MRVKNYFFEKNSIKIDPIQLISLYALFFSGGPSLKKEHPADFNTPERSLYEIELTQSFQPHMRSMPP
jgi:hypothetical protein